MKTKIHQENALEFFFKDGDTKLVSFEEKRFIKVYNAVKSKKLIVQPQSALPAITKKWQNGDISNFDYLMTLNMFSGRTFNDITQYPIMPWVITDFESKKFNPNDSMFLRDLRKPMSQIGQERLTRIIKKMQEIGFSNFALPGSILRPCDIESYLCRLCPFSEMTESEGPMLSIMDAFTKATVDDSCYSELIPEFYYMPEAFIRTRPDNKVPEMVLPNWASDPYTFVYLNRKALESDLVSSSLNQWIDLVWGTKQDGSGAISTFNKFSDEVYEDAKNSDDYEKHELATGLNPSKIFNEPHPPRMVGEKKEYLFNSPLIIQTQSTNIIYSDFFKTGKVISALAVDSEGKATSYILDFGKLQKSAISSITRTRERFLSDLPVSEAKSQLFETNIQNYNLSSIDNSSTPSSPATKDLGTSYTAQAPGVVSSYSFERLLLLSRSQFSPSPTQKATGTQIIIPPPSSTICIPNFSKIKITGKSGQFQLISSSILAIVDDGVVTLFNLQTGQVSRMKSHLSDVTMLFSNKKWIATTSRGAVLTLYKMNNPDKYIYSIPLYRDTIQCAYVSSQFSLAVAGTRDGFLFLISLTTGTSDGAVDLKGARPYKVLVTPSWGFILVYMTELNRGVVRRALALYSPNGNLIKRTTIAHSISAWSCFKTKDGFDYIVCADDRGRIWLFETFLLMLDESIYRCNGQVSAVMYSLEHGGVIATTTDGRILFVPSPL